MKLHQISEVSAHKISGVHEILLFRVRTDFLSYYRLVCNSTYSHYSGKIGSHNLHKTLHVSAPIAVISADTLWLSSTNLAIKSWLSRSMYRFQSSPGLYSGAVPNAFRHYVRITNVLWFSVYVVLITSTRVAFGCFVFATNVRLQPQVNFNF